MAEVRAASAGRASIYTLLGTVLNAGLAFVIVGMVSNTLGAFHTGTFFQGIALFSVTATAIVMGTDTTMVRTASRLTALGEKQQLWRILATVLATVLVVSVAVTALVWWSAPGIAGVLADQGHADRLSSVIRALVPFLPAAALLATLLGASRGLGQLFPYTLIQNTLLPVARVLTIAVAASGSVSLVVLVFAWGAPLALAAALAGLVVLYAWRRSSHQGHERPASGDMRAFWGFALPRGAAALVERALEWVDVLLVIALAGPATGGIYAVVRRVAAAGGLLESTMRIVTGPMVSRAFARQEIAEVGTLFRHGSAVLLLLSGPVYVSLIVFADPVLSLFGPEFPAGSQALAIVAVAFLVESACGMLQTILLMAGRSHWQLRNKLVQLAVLVVGVLALVPSLGLRGAAVAWAGGVLVNLLLAAGQVARLCGVRPSLRAAALPLLLVGVCFGLLPLVAKLIWGQGILTMLGSLGVSGIIYLGFCYRLRYQLPLAAFWDRT